MQAQPARRVCTPGGVQLPPRRGVFRVPAGTTPIRQLLARLCACAFPRAHQRGVDAERDRRRGCRANRMALAQTIVSCDAVGPGRSGGLSRAARRHAGTAPGGRWIVAVRVQAAALGPLAAHGGSSGRGLPGLIERSQSRSVLRPGAAARHGRSGRPRRGCRVAVPRWIPCRPRAGGYMAARCTWRACTARHARELFSEADAGRSSGRSPARAEEACRSRCARKAHTGRAVAAWLRRPAAGRAMHSPRPPSRRGTLLQALAPHLGMKRRPSAACCATGTHPGRARRCAERAVRRHPAALQPFYTHCAACHDMPSPSPPGFFTAASRRWKQPRTLRAASASACRRGSCPRAAGRTPMPPPVARMRAGPRADISARSSTLAMRVGAVGWPPERGYEALPQCRRLDRNARCAGALAAGRNQR